MSTAHQNININTKSVAHGNLFDKSDENSRVRDQRNRSVFNKQELNGVQKTNAVPKKVTKQLNTQRGSLAMNQNFSVLNLQEKYKQLTNDSQKLKQGTLQNSSQINLANRYGKKNKEKTALNQNKIKTENID